MEPSTRRLPPWAASLLALLLLAAALGGPAHWPAAAQAPDLVVYAATDLGPMDRFWAGFGFMDLYAHMDPESGEYPGDQALFDLVAEVNQRQPGTFEYVRFFDLLSDRGQWPGGQEFPLGCVTLHPERDFSRCDRYFDRLLQMGVKPLAILGFTPPELASDESLWGKAFTGANVSPPNDYGEWQRLVRDVVDHFTQRYGSQEVGSWIWEVWNEPDLFGPFWIEETYCGGRAYSSQWPVADRCFSDADCGGEACLPAQDANWFPVGDMLEYTRLYDFTVAGVLEANPAARIAGAVNAGSYIEPLLMHLSGISISGASSADPEGRNWATGQIGGGALNYISYHVYGADPDSFIAEMEQMEDAIASVDRRFGTNYRSYPTLISEYSPYTLSPHAYVTRYPAAWLAAVVDAILERADAAGNPNLIPAHMNYLTTPVARDFGENGGETDGLATTIGASTQVVKLPIFNAFEALGRLRGRRIQDLSNRAGAGAIAARDLGPQGEEVLSIAIYTFDPQDPEALGTTLQALQIQIRDLSSPRYTLEQYRIDHQYSNAYQLWKQGVRDLETLQANDDLQLAAPPSQLSPAGGILELELQLAPNSLALLVLRGEPAASLIGDLNQDGAVNGADVQLMVALILGGTEDQALRQRADLDQNGLLNALDLQQLINLALASPP